MKNYLTFLGALAAGSIAVAQSSSPEIRSFLESPAYAKSLIAGYGVDSDISPKPNDEEITQIQTVSALLQSTDPAQLSAGAQALEQYLLTKKPAEGDSKGTGVVHQIVGALNFSLASKATNEAQIKTYREKAIKYLDQAVKLFPNYRQAHKNLARLYFQIGEDQYIDLALKHFAKSIELGDKEAATYILLSKLYFDRQLFVAAETAARQAIMMDPKIKESRTILAYSLFQQERYAEAQGVFKELLEDEPNNSDIWLMIGNTFLQDNRIDEAAQQLEIVRLMGKADSRTMSLLGDVYMNKSMVEDAKEAYSQSLKLAASESGGLKNPEEFISSVRSLNNYQEYELAMSLLNEVSDAFEGKLDDAKRNEILVLSSEINIALGQDAKAVEDLKGILDIDPLNGRALLSLGQYYSRLKTDDQAKRLEAVELALGFYRRAQDLIDLGREGDEETARQAYVGAGQLLAREKRLREALNALEEAQAILYQDRIANYIDMIRSVSSRNS